MSKNFADWHAHKSSINAVQESPPYFHEREIWWVAVGLNVGYEVDGKSPAPTIPYTRPVIICKKFSGMFFGIPLSTQIKSGSF
jgi:hypothetical protein